jgi:hypothetical protein
MFENATPAGSEITAKRPMVPAEPVGRQSDCSCAECNSLSPKVMP